MAVQAPINKPSELLDDDENSLLFSLLGPQCTTMATTVAQLCIGKDGRWICQGTGVLCFVRDANACWYYLRFYILDHRQMVLELGIYRDMVYDSRYPFFHQVKSADNKVVGFNFVDEDSGLDEAHEFAEVLKAKVEKISLPGCQQIDQRAPVDKSIEGVKREADTSPGAKTCSTVEKPSTASAGACCVKVRREDIGEPTKFRHVQHVGYDNLSENDGGGGIQKVEISEDPVLKFLFGQIGQDFEQTMQTKKGAKKVEQFVANMGGMDRVRQMATETGYALAPGSQQQPLPPPPNRAAPQASRELPPMLRQTGCSVPPPPPPPNRPSTEGDDKSEATTSPESKTCRTVEKPSTASEAATSPGAKTCSTVEKPSTASAGACCVKVRREDIGEPTNFRHIQHVGYDNLSENDGGGIQQVEISDDPVLKFLFGQIGQDFEQTMQTKKGAKKVEQFVADMGGMDRVRQIATETGYAQPPPLPPNRAAPQGTTAASAKLGR